MAKIKLTEEERAQERARKAALQRVDVKQRLADTFNHVHRPTENVTVNVSVAIKKRTRAMFWRCTCNAVFDGMYWYRKENT